MSQMMIDQALRSAILHHQGGRVSEAEAVYRQILTLQPNHAAAAHLLGVLAGQSGRLEMAVEWIGRAIKLMPGEASYHSNLGKFLMDKGALPEAIAAGRRAVELSPAFAEGHYNLGNALHVAGRLEEAIASYQQAIRLKPGLAAGYKNLGNALRELGRIEEAVAAYGEALRLNPGGGGVAEVHGHLGVILRIQGRLEEAEAAFRRGLGIKPDSADVLNNLGHTLQIQGKVDEAIGCYREALRMEPNLAEAHNNLGSALKDQGDIEGAVAAYRRAIALKPENTAVHSNLLVALNYYVDSTRESLWREAVLWGRGHAAGLARGIQPHANKRDAGRILRVGYVSADFRQHASAFFLMPLFRHHDPRQVEVFCYADVDRADETTRQLQGYVKEWRNVAGLSDARVAQMVREDGIDILVDLKLHTERNRLLVFARKPAPVQVTWLGYPGTTGLETMDYRLTDRYLDPTGADDAFYTEKSVRLGDSFWCYDPLAQEPAVNGLPALTHGYVTLGCLNDFAKINRRTVELWAEILRAVEKSKLMLLAPEGSARQKVLEGFERRGISSERIVLEARRPRLKYLELYQDIDMALDTWPCNGHTTSLDSFWMGVPVVTLVGPTAMGRAGLSQVMNLKLAELAASEPEKYIGIATVLAADLPRLTAMRAGLRERMRGLALMEGASFAGNVEVAYRRMWEKWCGRAGAD